MDCHLSFYQIYYINLHRELPEIHSLKVDLPSFKYVDYKRSLDTEQQLFGITCQIICVNYLYSLKNTLKNSDAFGKISFNLTGRALRSNDFIY